MDLFEPLLDNPDVFIAGVEGVRWTSIAEALATCWSLLSITDRAAWEAKILDHWPELDEARRVAREDGEEEGERRRQRVYWRLQANGIAQRAILTTIGKDRLSPVAARRLAELDRKFKNAPIPVPHRTRAGYVRSPIAPETAKRMGVDDWLSAVSRYRSPSEREWTDNGPIGGSEQLAHILEIWCKEHPVEGAELLRRFPSDTLQTYFRAAVTGLRDSAADYELAVETARFAAGFVWAAEHNPFPRFVHLKPETIADDAVFEAVLGFARDISAGEREERKEQEGSSNDTTLEAILSQADHAAFNYSRTLQGEALEALGDGVERVPSRLPEVAAVVCDLARSTISPGIRCCLVSLAHSIATQDADQGLALLEEITSIDPLGLATRRGMELVVWSLHQRSELGNRLMERMLASADVRVRPAALWVLGRYGCRNDVSADHFQAYWRSEPLARRMAARLAIGWCKDNEPLEPRSVAWLTALFDDEDEDVRQEAAAYGREVLGPDLADRAALAIRLAGSRAFITDPDDLLIGLREAGAELPEVVIAAAKAYFAGQDDPDSDLNKRGRTSGFTLTQTVLAAYRHLEDDQRFRRDALDIIDAMVLRDSYGVRNEIGALER